MSSATWAMKRRTSWTLAPRRSPHAAGKRTARTASGTSLPRLRAGYADSIHAAAMTVDSVLYSVLSHAWTSGTAC